MRLLLVAALGVLLAGCYESRTMLLDEGAARQPVKTAQDWKYSNSEGTFHARLTPRSDGWYDYTEAEVSSDGSEDSPDEYRVVLNHLNKTNGADVYIMAMWSSREQAYVYGLVAMRPDINWRVVIPNCDGFTSRGEWHETDRLAAQLARATRPRHEAGCYFTTAASLRNAMTRVTIAKNFWDRVNAQ